MKMIRASFYVLAFVTLFFFSGRGVIFSAVKKPVVHAKNTVTKLVKKPTSKVVTKKAKKSVKRKSKNGTSKILCTTNCPLITPH